MAGLSGFASHWCSLHLGAGCQWWKLQDVSGTQPPHSDAVNQGMRKYYSTVNNVASLSLKQQLKASIEQFILHYHFPFYFVSLKMIIIMPIINATAL